MSDEEDDALYNPFMDDNQEPDYYECFCCGHSQSEKPSSFGCPKCVASGMEPGYF